MEDDRGRIQPCRDGDDDEDCDSESSGATGDFLLLHNDAGVDRSASTSSSSSSLTPSDRTASSGSPPPPPTSAVRVSPAPRGVASKRSGTDADDGKSVAGGPSDGGGRGDGAAAVPSASTTGSRLAFHVGLIAGSAVGVVFVLLLAAFAVYKYRSRDQGSYRLDPDAPNGYVPSPGGERYRLRRTSSSGLASSGPSDQNGGGSGTIYRLRNSRSRSKNRRDIKEWYV